MAVLVAPKSEVGEGPAVAEPRSRLVGSDVGVAFGSGVRVAVGVKEAVADGRAVGMTCCTPAPHPPMHPASKHSPMMNGLMMLRRILSLVMADNDRFTVDYNAWAAGVGGYCGAEAVVS
jgi:hypothetical protein